jgi:hypothetical protein
MKLLAQRKTMTPTSMAYAHDAAHLFLRKKATGMASDQPLFDFEAPAHPAPGVDPCRSETGVRRAGAEETCADPGKSPARSAWREVPQALFMSWSDAMQLKYCAARDRDSATTARLRGEDPEFYLRRAESYDQ